MSPAKNRLPRNAIVTGSASGLGRSLCLRLARDGWQIALADVDQQGNEETLRQVEAAGGNGHCELLDVSDPKQWNSMLGRLQECWQDLDLLINNAGVCGGGDVGSYQIDNWHWLLNINLYGTIYGCHTMVEWLKSNPNGSYIINSASIAAMTSAPGLAAYNVAKSGIVSFSETLFTELVNHDVGVSVLCPGFFDSHLLQSGRIENETQRKVAQQYSAKSKFGADDVADAAIAAMMRKRFYVVVGRKARFFWRMKRLFPQTILKYIGRSYPKELAKFTAAQNDADSNSATTNSTNK